jgi:hypothetical protein
MGKLKNIVIIKNNINLFSFICLLINVFSINDIARVDEDEDDNDEVPAVIEGVNEKFDLFSESPSKDADSIGMWSTSADWPLYAIHAAVLPNRKVITYGTGDGGNGRALQYNIWDPITGEHDTLAVQTNTNLFCSAQNVMVNGKLLITGGDKRPNGDGNTGIQQTNIYDPETNMMTFSENMKRERWYPTLITLPNGRMLVHGGRQTKTEGSLTPEVYNIQNGNYRSLNDARSEEIYTTDDKGKGWYYPRTFINNQGNAIFFVANKNNIYELKTKRRGEITEKFNIGDDTFSFTLPTAQFTPGKVLAFTKKKKVLIIDINKFTSDEIVGPNRTRIWSDATILADGKVLISGGATERQKLEYAVKEVDIFNPADQTWSVGAEAENARLYHSSAVLLPNGAVLVAGGGPPGPIKQRNAEVYYPPYLFTSNNKWAQRPIIDNKVKDSDYKKSINIKYTHNLSIKSVSLVKLGSTTHSYDMGQIFKSFKVDSNNGNVSIKGKYLKRSQLTPGYYMVFLIDSKGVPSEARIIKLGLLVK